MGVRPKKGLLLAMYNYRFNQRVLIAGVIIAVVGFIFQIALQQGMRSYARAGIYYQGWSSEDMMQTVSIEDLRAAPLKSLFNLHIQPPAFDAIRAILAHIRDSKDSHVLLQKVDRSLNILGAVLYGLLGTLTFLWLSKTTRWVYAFLAALLFMAHPACIFYATFLDTTLLSAVLILWAYYLLWSCRASPQKSIVPLALAVIVLFFTRSLFQWPSLFIFAISLLLLNVHWRKVVVFLLISGVMTGIYIGKQYRQFGITATSSFTGLNLSKSFDLPDYNYWHYLDNPDNAKTGEPSLPNVLIRTAKITGKPNFNHVSYLRLNQVLINEYKKHFVRMPLKKLLNIYNGNTKIYFSPSSRYTQHVIVDRIPWREMYDCIFSAPVLPGLLLLAGLGWMIGARRRDYMAGLAIVLPGAMIFLTSVLFEKGENMRFKFFLEPVLFVFIASQIYVILRNTILAFRAQFWHPFPHENALPGRS